MSVHRLSAGLIFVVLLMGPTTAAQDDSQQAWTIDSHTILRDETRDFQGGIAILNGGKLTLEGSQMRVGGLIHVHEGGTLELLPSPSGAGSRLSALPGGPGFWLLVDGSLVSHGSPGARISSLWGDGLTAAMPGNEGGLKVYGDAQLEGILIDSSSAGLFVGQGANVIVQDSTLQGLGEAGLISMGRLALIRTTVADHEINLLGKDTCHILVQDSQILDALAEQVLINGCQTVIRESVLSGGGVGVVANNAANVTVEDSVIQGYGVDGLGSYAGPGPAGKMLRPTVRFLNVTLAPAPGGLRGADLMGNALVEFRNVTIAGHESHGVQASQAVLSMSGSTFGDNGGYGIQLAGGRFAVDPLTANNRFDVGGTSNTKGALSHVVIANFHAAREGPTGLTPLPGDLEVTLYSSAYGLIDPIVSRNSGPGSKEIWFDIYENADDSTVDKAPVEYHALHGSWTGLRKGHVGPTEPVVILSIETAQSSSWNYVSLTLMALGVALMIPPIGSPTVRANLRNRLRRLRKKLSDDALPKG